MQFQISSRRENRQRSLSHQGQSPQYSFSKQFCFIICRTQHLWVIEQRRYSRFTLVENTITNSPKVLLAKSLGIDKIICFISICKFSNFKNPFAMITSLSKLYFRFRRFVLLLQMKKVIYMSYCSSTSSSKPWRSVNLDSIIRMKDV